MRNARRATSIVLAALGAVALVEGNRLQQFKAVLFFTAGTVPLLIGAGLLFVAVIIFIAPGRDAMDSPWPDRGALRSMGATTAILTAYCLLLPVAGYLLASLIGSAVLFRVIGQYGWTRSLAYGVAASVALYLIFARFAGVPLPAGFLG